MSSQITSTKYYPGESLLLDFESFYMDELNNILCDTDFKDGLNETFDEINRNKTKILDDYKGISIINSPIERYITCFLYKQFFEYQRAGKWQYNTVKPYPMPECGDLGLELEDVVLCIEVKTINKTQNPSDLGYIQFRSNQTSFETFYDYPNCNVPGLIPQFHIKGNVQKVYGTKPVLTYIIEIVYEFDTAHPKSSDCKLFTGTTKDGISAINLFCIPNGDLKRLFNNNIFKNIKAYKYYDESSKDSYYTPIKLDITFFPRINDCLYDITKAYAYIRTTFSSRVTSHWKEANNTDYIVFIDTSKKGVQNHELSGMLWVLTQKKDASGTLRPIIRCIKSYDGCRIGWKENLIDRYDGSKTNWKGVIHITI